MKKQLIYILIAATSLATVACNKDSVNFIRDNTTTTGVGGIPVSTNALTELNLLPAKTLSASLTTASPTFAAGANLRFELQYFSETPVKEINLYSTVGAGARTKVFTQPYAPAFSAIKRLDTLLVPYVVPLATPSTTGIKLEFEILNQNTLSLTRTGWMRVL
jgi:hypothetical protein